MQPPNHSQPMQQQPFFYGEQPQAPSPQKPTHGKKTVILVILLLLISAVVVLNVFFRLDKISVVGCVNVTEQEVIMGSGLYLGQNMLTIDKQLVEKAVNKNRYLIFQDLKRDYRTRTVTIYVYERIPTATMQTLGIQYTIDAMGVVLEQTEDLSKNDGMIELTGMQTGTCGVGREINAKNAKQLDVYKSVLYELNSLGYRDQVVELNVFDLDNLYIVTKDGMAIRLGVANYMHAKILSLITVKTEVTRMGMASGTIDVSSPVYPVYIP